MRTGFIYIFCVMMYAGFVLSACGTDPKVQAATETHTEGQQLNDLKTARNRGAINHDEYEEQKQAIFDKYED